MCGHFFLLIILPITVLTLTHFTRKISFQQYLHNGREDGVKTSGCCFTHHLRGWILYIFLPFRSFNETLKNNKGWTNNPPLFHKSISYKNGVVVGWL